MVVPRLEQGVEPLHPLQPDQRVAERELQRVPGVQLAGHVRGRVRVDERGPRRIRVRVVEALGLPGLLPPLLDTGGLVARLHLTLHEGAILGG